VGMLPTPFPSARWPRPQRRGAIFQSSPLPSSVTTYSAPSGPCRTSRTR